MLSFSLESIPGLVLAFNLQDIRSRGLQDADIQNFVSGQIWIELGNICINCRKELSLTVLVLWTFSPILWLRGRRELLQRDAGENEAPLVP
jgi:hypothetical protein